MFRDTQYNQVLLVIRDENDSDTQYLLDLHTMERVDLSNYHYRDVSGMLHDYPTIWQLINNAYSTYVPVHGTMSIYDGLQLNDEEGEN